MSLVPMREAAAFTVTACAAAEISAWWHARGPMRGLGARTLSDNHGWGALLIDGRLTKAPDDN
eukprot:scaffold25786_cov26-Tisochrysis_lutea.AAC.1